MDDTPFVVSYQIVYTGDGEDDEIDDYDDIVDDADANRFRFVVPTERLLQIASKSNKIHEDAMYKLVWQGFPVLVLGAINLNRHFHPYATAVYLHEKNQDFIFIFRGLRRDAQTFGLGEMNPGVLIADSIRNTFKHFSEKNQWLSVRLICDERS